MHDPMTLAHEIKSPFRSKPSKGWPEGYRNPLVTIWHCDPEKDGSDDSCGWFMRGRHGDPKVLDKIVRDFEFQWSHGVPFGWFDGQGNPNYSPHSIVLGMFLIAANNHFGHWSRRGKRFLRDHAFEILHFAENSNDSLWTGVTRHYQRQYDEPERRKERVREMAGCVYSWILRADRPWWRHPKWHVHHWRLQVHPLQALRRRLFTRCEACGGRFRSTDAAVSGQWDSPRPRWFEWFRGERGLRHMRCDRRRSESPVCNANGGVRC